MQSDSSTILLLLITSYVVKFQISQPCNELLITCIFLGKKVDCSEIFYPVITDEGQCCAFNIMPEEIMMRADAAQV